jgi:large subunit ribosomal protein L29
MKAKEFRERTDDELVELQREYARDLFKARLDNHTNQLDDTSKIQKLRRNIACIKTILTERQRQGSTS